MKALHEIWNVTEDKIDLVAEYPFKLRGYEYTKIDLEAFKAMCIKTGTDPRQGEIYPQWDGFRFVPTLTSDGWLRVANDHPQFDGMAINYSEKEVTLTIGETTVIGAEFVEVTVHRKDRTHHSSVREYFRETFNQYNPTHFTHPNRNTRHKAIAQAVKIAFGISGAYVQGEAEALSASVPESDGPKGVQASTVSEHKPAAKQQQGETRRPRVQTKPLDNTPPVTVVQPKPKQAADPEPTEETPTVEQEQVGNEVQEEKQDQSVVDSQLPEEHSQEEQELPTNETANTSEQSAEPEQGDGEELSGQKQEEQIISNDEPQYEPTPEQQDKLKRFLEFTQASGQYERAREFLKGGIQDSEERKWYSYHLEQLLKEVSYA